MPDKIPFSTNDYNCPKCGAPILTNHYPSTMVSQTEPEFVEEPDPHCTWTEVHKCEKCESLFNINNGT